MKNILFAVSISILCLPFFSCDKDNLDGPDAIFYGEIRDRKTGELLEQEIINGSKIYYIEQGWPNPQVQEMVIKKDGTFRNNMMFSGEYKVILTRGNYVSQDTIEMRIGKGNNFKVFEVVPYVRIIEPEIKKEGNEIVARFRLEQVAGSKMFKVGLFGHSHIDVSNALHTVQNVHEINDFVSETQEFKLSFNLDTYKDQLVPGKSYYFRIGALSHGAETKFNYCTAVKIDI